MKNLKSALILATLLLVLTACSDATVLQEDTVQDIQFINQSGDIMVETERIVIATEPFHVKFIEASDDLLIIQENDTATAWLGDARFEYTIHIPTGQVKEISRLYAQAFGETLPIEQPDSDK